MNTVLFDSPFDRNIFVRSNKVFWEYTWQKRKKQITHWAGMGVIFIGLGIWTKTQGGEPGNPYFFIGAVFCCFMLWGGLELFFSRGRHNKKIEDAADEYEKADAEHVLKISEKGIELKDFQSHIMLNWSVFKNFTLYKDHILLFPKNYLIGGLVIDKNSEDPDKYRHALAIIEDKLIEV